jgi:uncharacterized glyoxalase superfamily protein PhnB
MPHGASKGSCRLGTPSATSSAYLASTGRIFLTFQLESPAAVDAKYAELVADGVPSLQEPFDAPWGMRYATVADPSGNGVDLFAGLASD